MDFQIKNENSSKENIYLKNQLKKLAEELPHKVKIILNIEPNSLTLVYIIIINKINELR